jgi:predicted PolB exonuclease-like 3'-5' exonuclease
MTPLLVFDIETVPDIEGIRKLNDLGPELAADDVAEMAFQSRRQATGNDFLQLHLQRVVAISCALRDKNDFRVWSLGTAEDSEDELIRRFFEGIDKYTPQLNFMEWGRIRSPSAALPQPNTWDSGTSLLGDG